MIVSLEVSTSESIQIEGAQTGAEKVEARFECILNVMLDPRSFSH